MPNSLLHWSDHPWLVFGCAVAFCAGIGLFIYGVRLRRRRLSGDTPLPKIGSGAVSPVEINGFAETPQELPRQPEVIQLSSGSGPTKSSEMNQQQKIAAALMKAGIANPATWPAAGISTADAITPAVQVLKISTNGGDANEPRNGDSNQANGFDVHPSVALMKDAKHTDFLTSSRSQSEITRSVTWKCTLMIWGGAALAIISLYLFFGLRNPF